MRHLVLIFAGALAAGTGVAGLLSRAHAKDQPTSTESPASPQSTQVEHWLTDLDAPGFAARERATRNLIAAGEQAVPVLAALAESRSLDTIDRCLLILRTFCTEGNERTAAAAHAALQKLSQSPDQRVARRALTALDDYDAWQRFVASTKIESLGGDISHGEELDEEPVGVRLSASWRGGDWGVDYLRTLTALQTVSFEDSSISDAALTTLVHLPQLERLNLGPSRIRGIGLAQLQTLSRLEHLSLRGLSLDPRAYDELGQLVRLQSLGLDGTTTTDEELHRLTSLRQLESLWLNSTKVTDAGLVYLQGFSELARLELAQLSIHGDGLRVLRSLPKLRYLSLEGSPLNDEGAKNLAELTQLTTLGLDGTRITDDGLAHLSGLENLEMLWLSGTAITDQGLLHLRGLKSLHILHVERTAVTPAGVRKLSEALPNVEVNFSTPGMDQP